jgi:hypothetical protein
MATTAKWRPRTILHPLDSPGYNDQELVIQALNDAIRDLEGRLDAVETSWANGTLGLITMTFTDHSGSITAGGTAQPLMNANASRKYLFIQNISSNLLWIDFGTAAVQDQPSIKLMPDSDAYKLDAGTIDTESVSIIGATTGQKFVAKEGV